MSGYVNRVTLIGNLGRDPETRSLQSGNSVTSFSMATTESWTEKTSGERREQTEWHRVVIFNEKLGEIVQRYARKGDKIYICGQIASRKYVDKDGVERTIVEIVLKNFGGEVQLLAPREDRGDAAPSAHASSNSSYRDSGRQPASHRSSGRRVAPEGPAGGPKWDADMDDEIPF
jgi:single-strand DNA-binding protein